jgi:hypothetical protein
MARPALRLSQLFGLSSSGQAVPAALLQVANLRVTADPGYSRFKVEMLPPPPGAAGSGLAIPLWDSKQSDKLRPIFALMLRRSSGHHPLLAGALRERGGGGRCVCLNPMWAPCRGQTCLEVVALDAWAC